MLKKTITYTDFNGDETTEDHYFHLSKAELIELEVSHKDGLSETLERIVAAEDGKAIMEEFKKIILASYGKRSEDGKRFIKTQEMRDEFVSSEAYSELFMELCTNPDKAAEFVNGIIPANLEQDVEALVSRNGTETANKTETTNEPRVISRAEAVAMPGEELTGALSRGEIVIDDSIESP